MFAFVISLKKNLNIPGCDIIYNLSFNALNEKSAIFKKKNHYFVTKTEKIYNKKF